MTFKMEFTKLKKQYNNIDPDQFRLVISKDNERLFVDIGEVTTDEITTLALLLNKFGIYTSINFTKE